MTLSAKWTAVTFSALTALGAGSFAFAGCTVTSGDPDNTEAGTGNNPPVDGGGGTDTSTAKACPGNTKQTVPFLPAACQTAMENSCCTEMSACFNITPAAGDGGVAADDCNKYTTCLEECTYMPGTKTPETDQSKIQECQELICDAASPKEVRDAYDVMFSCLTAKTGTSCQ